MKKAAFIAVVAALALPAAVLAQAPSYLHNAPSDAARPAVAIDNPIYLHYGPSDAVALAPEPLIYLHYGPSDTTSPGAVVVPVAPAEPSTGFDWGDALIGAGVAIGVILLLGMAAGSVRHYGGHGRPGGLATGH